MYAVIKVGGKQYRVEQGQTLLVDRQRHAAGDTFSPDVLMTGGDDVVTDRSKLEGAVSAKVVEHLRGEKIKVFTYKPKRGEKKARGHRSELTRISVESIGGASKPKRTPARKAEAEPAAAPAAEEKPARATRSRAAAKPKADAPAARPRPTRAKKEDAGDGA
jgi:large subunit ribosomal protein L21